MVEAERCRARPVEQSRHREFVFGRSRALTSLAQRSMDLHCTIQDGQVLIGDGTNAAQMDLLLWKEPARE